MHQTNTAPISASAQRTFAAQLRAAHGCRKGLHMDLWSQMVQSKTDFQQMAPRRNASSEKWHLVYHVFWKHDWGVML